MYVQINYFILASLQLDLTAATLNSHYKCLDLFVLPRILEKVLPFNKYLGSDLACLKIKVVK